MSQGHSKGHRRTGRSLDSSLKDLSIISTSKRSPSPKDEEIDIISYSQVSTSQDVNIKILAQSTLYAALDNATYGQTGDRLVYGNTLGVQLINERDDYRSTLERLEMEILKHKNEISEMILKQDNKILKQDNKILVLQTQVKELTTACQGYLNIRHRFLDTFRRDILNDPTAKWASTIQAGNIAAYNGDAVTDAGLFETVSRKDKSLMIKVYGITAEQVLSLSRTGDYDSIAVLNARATLKSNKDKPIPQDIEDAWNTFVAVLENSDQFPKEDPTSALGQAYYRFWDTHNRHKK